MDDVAFHKLCDGRCGFFERDLMSGDSKKRSKIIILQLLKLIKIEEWLQHC